MDSQARGASLLFSSKPWGARYHHINREPDLRAFSTECLGTLSVQIKTSVCVDFSIETMGSLARL